MSELRTPLESWAITPTCRVNRGDDGAWDEAVAQLRQVYDAQVQRFGPTATLTLAIFRARAESVPQYVYEACLLAGPSPAQPADPPRCEHGKTVRHPVMDGERWVATCPGPSLADAPQPDAAIPCAACTVLRRDHANRDHEWEAAF